LAKYLAIDWDQKQLHVVAGTVNRGVVKVTRAVVWDEERAPNPAEAEALGELLRERLKAEKIAPAPVLLCVGRDRVILKEVRYPQVPQAEEPGVVRFQAVKELTDAADEVVIDYTTAGETNGSGERRAYVLALRRELLAAYQTLCRSAGLKLLAVTPRPFAALGCLEQALPGGTGLPAPEPAAATALLTVAGRWAELCIAGQGRVLLARHLAVGDTLPGEVRRSLALQAGQQRQNPVRVLYLAGDDEAGSLRQRLETVLTLPVHALDPLAGSAPAGLSARSRGAFTGPVGLLHAWAKAEPLPINFVAPKEPKRPRDPNKHRLIFAASALAALVVGGIAFAYAELASKDREIARLTFKKLDLDSQLVMVDEEAKRLKAISEWEEGAIVWLDELYDLVERFPDSNGIRMTTLTADSMTRGKDKYVARMNLKGVTTSDYTYIDTLEARLDEEKYYRPLPKKMDQNTSSRQERFRFPLQFTTGVQIEKRPPSEYSLQLQPPDRNEGRGSRGGGQDFFQEGGLQ
jgi:Tfp pilus assembly PilM family ATPase